MPIVCFMLNSQQGQLMYSNALLYTYDLLAFNKNNLVQRKMLYGKGLSSFPSTWLTVSPWAAITSSTSAPGFNGRCPVSTMTGGSINWWRGGGDESVHSKLSTIWGTQTKVSPFAAASSSFCLSSALICTPGTPSGAAPKVRMTLLRPTFHKNNGKKTKLDGHVTRLSTL